MNDEIHDEKPKRTTLTDAIGTNLAGLLIGLLALFAGRALGLF